MYNLSRFLNAQETDYQTALAEIKNGHKTSHWIWYIFPQLKNLGRSRTAIYYGIENLDEAKEYLANETLRERLLEISGALLELKSNDIEYIMGSSIDKKKLQSSMTLFHLAEPTLEIFTKVLEKYFGGQLDLNTVNLCKTE
ncbi:MAG: DUF1810 domain-containing protein [Selenomonadaceae bacterium]|nr:DUF1810 domain-containing protein [Selenomonadaceae bacterium]